MIDSDQEGYIVMDSDQEGEHRDGSSSMIRREQAEFLRGSRHPWIGRTRGQCCWSRQQVESPMCCVSRTEPGGSRITSLFWGQSRTVPLLDGCCRSSSLTKRKSLWSVPGFIGVEWLTELGYFFPQTKLTIIDFLPRCLGPCPTMLQTIVLSTCPPLAPMSSTGANWKNEEFGRKIELPGDADDASG